MVTKFKTGVNSPGQCIAIAVLYCLVFYVTLMLSKQQTRAQGLGLDEVIDLVVSVLEKLQADLDAWRSLVPATLHPMRALSFVRSCQKIPAQKIADMLGVSRSYIAALENYAKPITEDFFFDYICPVLDASRPSDEIKKVLEAYYKLQPKPITERAFSTGSWLEKIVSNDLAYDLAHCIFEALSNLSPYVEVVFDKTKQDVFEYLVSTEGITWPSPWPERYLPRMILTTQQSQSLILSWLAGITTTEDLIGYYAGNYTPNPQILMHRRFNPASANISGLIALALFLFDSVRLEVVPRPSVVPPLYLSVVFQGKRLSPLGPGVTWFNLEEIVRLQDLPIFEEE